MSSTATAASSTELTELGLAEAAASIRNGETTSEAYTSGLLKQAKKYATLNSFITIDEISVLSAARDADKARAAGLSSRAPLLGVPIGVKDSYATRGLPTSLGLKLLKDYVPSDDAETVQAIKNAGGIVFGKNNLVEMSYGLVGHNLHFEQVKNPYGLEHVSGGSSSGSGASVAARIVPASLGGDTIGSIRVPASLCGVVGFKPTTGRWPVTRVAPIADTLDTTGVLARKAEDCALIDQIVTNSSALPTYDRSDLKGTRFIYAPRQYLDWIDPEVEARFRETLRALREAGAAVLEVDLGDDFSELAGNLTWAIMFRETHKAISTFLTDNHLPVSFEDIHDALKPELKGAWSHLVLPTGAGYISDEAFRKLLMIDRPELQRRLANALIQNDSIAHIFPTTPCPAPRIDEQSSFKIADKEATDLTLSKNTIPTSGAGLPGINIPIGLSSAGLPIGLEIDSASGNDRTLLEIGRRVQAIVGELPAPTL
ncbi:amidase family protein [Bradyrhizobium pachyrhizi]|uniref:amidase family protein n=1 Tax=Bradyrhizobium pachyrhizi TaxID=280333 RepID=UPI00067B41A8|nr:amidase family protein [Bradyrhizobium pachyrhizi]